MGVYETVRVYSRVLGVSWFTLEALCDSLASRAPHNTLLSELHCAMLAAVMQTEEADGALYTPGGEGCDVIMALNAAVIDRHTWPHVLYRYLSASHHALAVLGSAVWSLGNGEYWQLSVDDKASIMHYLAAAYTGTPAVREIVAAGGHLLGPDWCAACGQGGDLVCCDSCPGVYHLKCAELGSIPAGAWHCATCLPLLVRGVHDGLRPADRDPGIRTPPLGTDAALRTYWFIARRVVVMDTAGDVVAYYYSPAQVCADQRASGGAPV